MKHTVKHIISFLKLTIVLFAFLSLSSCKKYLDKIQDTAFAYPTTVENLQAVITEAIVSSNQTPDYIEVAADDFFEPVAALSNTSELQGYTWQLPFFDVPIRDNYARPYTTILQTNIVIREIEKIAVTASNMQDWNTVKGSGYFLRAYHFLYLTWTFSKAYDSITSATDLGIVLKKNTDINDPSVRSTVEESYHQIISDAKAAVDFLPDYAIHPKLPSKAAAYGLLARAYLSMRVYDSAFKYSDKCLQLKSELMNFNGDADITGSISAPTFRKYNKETIFYSEAYNGFGISRPSNSFVDTLLYQSYTSDDLRKGLFFYVHDGYNSFRGGYSQSNDYLFSGITTDEMLLTRAECYARLGNKAAALSDLNSLLTTRWKTGTFTPFTANTSTEALDIILQERRKELLMRTLRWIDIKRLNKENRNIILKRIVSDDTYELLPNDNRYALPLPREVIQMTGMLQNEDWD